MTIPLIIYWVNLSLDSNNSGWVDCTLGDIVTFKRGYDLPKGKMNDGKYPVVGSNGIIGFHDEFTTESPGITIGRSGNVGKPFIVKEQSWSHNTTLFVEKFKNVDPYFVYYYLKTIDLKQFAGGSAVPTLNRNHIHPIDIRIPADIIEQKKISRLLLTFDEKIEVLKKININLLAIADAVFKKEFRNFEGYSEDDLIASDFGLIPKNWHYDTLDEISDVAIGKTPPRKETWWFSEKEGVKWVSIKDLGNSGTYVFETSEYLTEEAIEKFNVKIIPEDTVILSFKLTVGRLGITTEEMVTNEAIAHFKLDQNSIISKEYLYLYLKNFNYEELGSTSSIAKAINSKIVKKIPVLIPTNNKMGEFKELFENIFNEIKSNQLEINNLTKLRDTLHPKLMSGEIDVSEINCDMLPTSRKNWDNEFTSAIQNNLIEVIS